MGDWRPDIVLAGVGIQKQHCRITHGKLNNKGPNRVWMHVDESAAAATTFVNGDNFFFEATPGEDDDDGDGAEGSELKHGDRLCIGQNYVFVFCDPTKNSGEICKDLLEKGKVSWERAKKELSAKQGDDNFGGGAQSSLAKSFEEDPEELKKREEEKKKMKAEYERKLQE